MPTPHTPLRAPLRRASKALAVLAALTLSSANGTALAEGGASWAVVAAIGAYTRGSGLAPLTWTYRDAEQMAAVLSRAGYRIWGGGPLLDDDATRANILEAVEAAGRRVERGGALLVYFSGHGYSLPGANDNHLATWDATRATLRERGLATGELLKTMTRATAARKLLVVDACREEDEGRKSSATPRGLERIPTEPIAAETDIGDGLYYAFSAGPGQFSWEDRSLGGGHGVFTYHLLEALRANAGARRGAIRAGELFQEVANGVRRWSQQNDRDQTPFHGGEYPADFAFSALCSGCAADPARREPADAATVALRFLDYVDQSRPGAGLLNLGYEPPPTGELDRFVATQLRYLARRGFTPSQRLCNQWPASPGSSLSHPDWALVSCTLALGSMREDWRELVLLHRSGDGWAVADFIAVNGRADGEAGSPQHLPRRRDALRVAARELLALVDAGDLDTAMDRYIHPASLEQPDARGVSRVAFAETAIRYRHLRGRATGRRHCKVPPALPASGVVVSCATQANGVRYDERVLFSPVGPETLGVTGLMVVEAW